MVWEVENWRSVQHPGTCRSTDYIKGQIGDLELH